MKAQLPEFLKNALCMTIYESKGLEFEDVLIYNFFHSSTNYQVWSLLRNITIITKVMSEAEYAKFKKNQEKGLASDNSMVFVGAEKSDDKLSVSYNVKFFTLDNFNAKTDFATYDELNDELKMFYVAVTRTKNRLVIYDAANDHNLALHPRAGLDTVWKPLGFVE
jgi:superfamily I DNA/RNA helicase